MGLLVAKFLDQKLSDQSFSPPPRLSALGSLLTAITDEFKIKHFQPTNINFSLLPPLVDGPRDKKERKTIQIQRARTALNEWIKTSHP